MLLHTDILYSFGSDTKINLFQIELNIVGKYEGGLFGKSGYGFV